MNILPPFLWHSLKESVKLNIQPITHPLKVPHHTKAILKPTFPHKCSSVKSDTTKQISHPTTRPQCEPIKKDIPSPYSPTLKKPNNLCQITSNSGLGVMRL